MGEGDDLCSDESDDQAEETELLLSELSLNGLDTSHTLKLFGSIGPHQVKIMVDSGASHCFISDQVVFALKLIVMRTLPYSVMLGDGSRVQAAEIYYDLVLTMASKDFSLSCYVFPLRNVDVILGITWLAALGDVTANWQTLRMTFSVEGRLLTIQGDPTLTRRA